LHRRIRLASTSLPPSDPEGRGAARRYPGTTCPRGRLYAAGRDEGVFTRPLPLKPEKKRRERRGGVGCGGLVWRRGWFPGPPADACCRRGMNCCCAVGAHSRPSLARTGKGVIRFLVVNTTNTVVGCGNKGLRHDRSRRIFQLPHTDQGYPSLLLTVKV